MSQAVGGGGAHPLARRRRGRPPFELQRGLRHEHLEAADHAATRRGRVAKQPRLYGVVHEVVHKVSAFEGGGSDRALDGVRPRPDRRGVDQQIPTPRLGKTRSSLASGNQRRGHWHRWCRTRRCRRPVDPGRGCRRLRARRGPGGARGGADSRKPGSSGSARAGELGSADQRHAGRDVAEHRREPDRIRRPRRRKPCVRPRVQPHGDEVASRRGRGGLPRGRRPRDARGASRAAVRMVDGHAGAARADARRRRQPPETDDRCCMKITSFAEFSALATQGTFVPVCKEIMADLLTPVSAFLKIAEHSDDAFLLESVEGGEHVGRYSFLGKDPFLVLRADLDGRTTIDRAGVTSETTEPFIPTLRRLMADFKSPVVPDLPRFTGGAVGFLGYDTTAWFEPVSLQAAAGGDEAEPAAGFMMFDTVLAFDHVRHRILIISNARVQPGDDLGSLYQFACAKIGFLERELQASLSQPISRPGAPLTVRSNITREQFEAAVRIGQEHIAAGDIYQVVLSQRFEADVEVDPFTVYRALRHVNPSPYMFFVRMGKRSIVGSSPEMLVRVEGDRVETHPIAGTRPRGHNDAEDVRLAEELKASEKERAEHVMLVDLGRNDVGRVAEYGTVRVPQFMGLEPYSHVMHPVSYTHL